MRTSALLSKASRRRQQGFTIVELAVVVGVIIILSIIVIAMYDNVGVQANDTSLKSDLDNAASILESDKLRDGTYPATVAAANRGQGLSTSTGNTFTYTLKPYGYCLYASNPEANSSYMIRNIDRRIKAGTCEVEVTSIAGPSTFLTGFQDGQGTAARFNTIEGIAVSKTGDIYVADYNNHRIRKVTQSGDVSTFAGTGGTGCTTGGALSAQIYRPHNMVFDPQGNLYVMGCSAGRIMKIDTTLTVSTLAGGGGSPNYCNGTSGTGTAFYWSRGLAIDNSNNLFVGATELYRVCKVTPSGTSTTYAGSGSLGASEGNGTSAGFNWPWGVVFDSQGNLFVNDQRNYKIRKITPTGDVSTFSGSGTPGTQYGDAASSRYNIPKNMTIDKDDNLYITDSAVIKKITPNGTSSLVYGGPWPGGGTPSALTMSKEGILYVGTPVAVLKLIL